MLWAEFWLHAARHPQVAERLAEQERRHRGAVARLLAVVAADLGAPQRVRAELGCQTPLERQPDIQRDHLGGKLLYRCREPHAIGRLLRMIHPPPAAGGPDSEGPDP